MERLILILCGISVVEVLVVMWCGLARVESIPLPWEEDEEAM